jgi:epsilon-lactone hydrolase
MLGNESRALSVPARNIPVPTTVSPQARAALSMENPYAGDPEPDPNDKGAWVARGRQMNAAMTEMLKARFAVNSSARLAHHDLSNARLYEITPVDVAVDEANKVILYVHGGGFTAGGDLAAAYAAYSIVDLAKLRIFSIDYRMPPNSPFPAGLDDTLEAYQYLLKRHGPLEIAVYGPSAGGGLAASFLLKARDQGLPMPAACVLRSPEADLTEAGDSFETNNGIDAIMTRLTNSIALYANGHDLRDPYLSPLYGDFSLGFPPTILTAGTRDLFLSNTVLMHRALRRAKVEAELHVWEAMSHAGFFGLAPEDREVLEEEVRFIRQHLSHGS